jgi:hypothetical protein
LFLSWLTWNFLTFLNSLLPYKYTTGGSLQHGIDWSRFFPLPPFLCKRDNDFMELLWSLGLIVFLLVALNHMAGGRASNVLRPVTNIASGLLSFAFRLCMSALGGIVRLLGGSMKLPGGSPKIRDDKMPPGRTPPRWDE